MTPLWTVLRPIGNSWAARLTILIPLVGYFIIFNDELSHSHLATLITELEGKTPENLGLSISPRLFQVYFGLCFVAVATALYAWACPGVIKRHPSAGEYIANEGHYLGEYGVREMEIALAQTNHDFDDFRQRIRNRISQDYSPQEALTEIKNASLFARYNAENQRYPFLRPVIASFYLVGFIILLIPAIRVFGKVSSVLFGLIEKYGISAIW
jgi:hypothetical protein